MASVYPSLFKDKNGKLTQIGEIIGGYWKNDSGEIVSITKAIGGPWLNKDGVLFLLAKMLDVCGEIKMEKLFQSQKLLVNFG